MVTPLSRLRLSAARGAMPQAATRFDGPSRRRPTLYALTDPAARGRHRSTWAGAGRPVRCHWRRPRRLPNLGRGPAVLRGMGDKVTMDSHTLELLEFNKVRELLAGYAACSLGKELARQVEPGTDADEIRTELALVSEMA